MMDGMRMSVLSPRKAEAVSDRESDQRVLAGGSDQRCEDYEVLKGAQAKIAPERFQSIESK